jgi:glycosyltransferase involved in cell wall biosynthesis
MNPSSESNPDRLDGGPIRVGFVLHVMQVAGAEVLVREMIRGLSGRIEPTVLCLDGIGPIGEALQAEGVPVVHLGRRPGLDWGVARRMAAEVRAREIEVLHAHQYTPFFYAALGKFFSGRPPALILTEHGRHYPDVVSTARWASNRFVLRHLADAVTGVSEFSLKGLRDADGFAGPRAIVIENGIDVDRYGSPPDASAMKARLGLDPSRRLVANIARHHPVKDQKSLIEGFRAVAAARPDVDLLMVGDGPLRGELEALAVELGLTGRVHFLGVRDDVPDLLRAADVFALTSLSEAASLTLMEAMASGLPVVVTDVGGNPELVRDGVDGLLVPRGDRRAIGSALLKILDDPALASAMGQAGRTSADRRFRLARTVENYLDLFRQVLPRRRRRRRLAPSPSTVGVGP